MFGKVLNFCLVLAAAIALLFLLLFGLALMGDAQAPEPAQWVCTTEDLAEYGEVEVVNADWGLAIVTTTVTTTVPADWSINFEGGTFFGGDQLGIGRGSWWAPEWCKPLGSARPVMSVTTPGPFTGTAGLVYTLTASLAPISATPPFLWSWAVCTDTCDLIATFPLSRATESAISLTLDRPGSFTILVQAEGRNSRVTSTISVTAMGQIFLPLVLQTFDPRATPEPETVCSVEDLGRFGTVRVIDATNGQAEIDATAAFVVPAGWVVVCQGVIYHAGDTVQAGLATWWAPEECKPLQ